MADDFERTFDVTSLMQKYIRLGLPEEAAKAAVTDYMMMKTGDRILRRKIKRYQNEGVIVRFLPEDVEFGTAAIRFPELGWVKCPEVDDAWRERLRMVYIMRDQGKGYRIVCDYWPKQTLKT